jgi:hypothetical protein
MWTLLAAIIVSWLAMCPHAGPGAGSGITRENFARIKKGMTEAEVDGILRCPPGDYTAGRRQPLWGIPAEGSFLTPDLNKPVRPEDLPRIRMWVSDKFAIVTFVSADTGKALLAYTLPVDPAPPSPPDHLLPW